MAQNAFSLARKTLNLTDNAPVPPAYLDELTTHVALYPNDINFTVTLQKSRGFGVAVCREAGCDNVPVALGPRADAVDGGRSEGFGSLLAYRNHVIHADNHKAKRNQRLRSTVLNPLNTPMPMVKPEPTESTIPRKRPSGSIFIQPQSSPSAKKLKRENTNPSLASPTKMNAADSAEIRLQITNIQLQISHQQNLLDRVLRKKRQSKADATRILTYQAEIRKLRQKKADLDASLPRAGASPIKRTGSLVKTESNPMIPHYNPASSSKVKMEDVKPTLDVKSTLPVKPRAGAYSSDDEMDVDPVNTLDKIGHAIPYIAPLAGSENFDEDGNWHGRGRDTFQGPQARADDIDKFLIEAGNAEYFESNVKIEDALKALGLKATHELIPGLEIPLMPHQLLAVSWMVACEQKKSLRGGILSDEMGLGKTVQMIATMVKNQPQDKKVKTTLILCPLALLPQWTSEIETKTNLGWRIHIYHGSNKVKKKSDLLAYDIVITTYGTMALEWPDPEADLKKQKAKAKAKKNNDDFVVSDDDDNSDASVKLVSKGKSKKKGLLFEVDFYRVVLDEAQQIRNKRTRISRAVTDLSAELRWCLTATPIVNALVDVFGLLRFLRIRPFHDWSEFNKNIALYEKKQPNVAASRLQTVFNLCLLRRLKTTELDGKRLIELPEKKLEVVSLQFSDEEREIYTQLETRQQAQFNRFLRAGSVLKNYASVLTMLLRLRQLCSHPALIQENGSYFLAPGEGDESIKYRDVLTRARNEVGAEFVTKMKAKRLELALRSIEAEKESLDAAAEIDDCPICFDAITDAVVTACGHEFCNDCIINFLQTAPLEENAGLKANERPCPACRTAICADNLFPVAAFEPTDAELANQTDEPDADSDIVEVVLDAKGKGKAKAKRPARKASKKFVVDSDEEEDDDQEDDYVDSDMDDFIVQSDEDEDEKDLKKEMRSRLKKKAKPMVILDSDEEEDTPEVNEVLIGHRKKKLTKEELKMMPRFLPSTKMKAMMEYIKKLAEEKPDEKTLVVSQWTSCLSIVSDYLQEVGIPHVKYQGDMTPAQRQSSVNVFMSKDKARVMLMSLKCGGVGLNLTRANNVVSLDLAWSPAIDHQAFDRVHRLGQHRPVLVQRLVIENTVEDRIMALQERKQNLADGSLGEGKGKKIGRLTVGELANLFGLDHRGRVLPKA
ncbi:SNF2 superfamily protein [Mycena kentingensis (nom. inval.)]|nr:SNF2 superfamily protein [Mycena kentingensis (nom. inval.)]